MLRHIRSGLIPTSLIYIVLGIFLLCWPDTSIRICCYAVGALLLIFGIIQIRRYMVEKGLFFLVAYISLIGGIISCAAGLFLLASPDTAISIFPILFGLFVIFDSVGRFSSALELRRIGHARWWSFLLLSALSILLGLFMVMNPFASVTAMVTAVGVVLLIEGFLNLFGLTYSSVLVYRFDHAASKAAAELKRRADEIETAVENAAGDETFVAEEDGPVIDVESRPVDDDK